MDSRSIIYFGYFCQNDSQLSLLYIISIINLLLYHIVFEYHDFFYTFVEYTFLQIELTDVAVFKITYLDKNGKNRST
jgi:hypothetical protein